MLASCVYHSYENRRAHRLSSQSEFFLWLMYIFGMFLKMGITFYVSVKNNKYPFGKRINKFLHEMYTHTQKKLS